MLQQQHPGTPIVLLGHSMGSYIAQAFAMFHDTRIVALALSASTWPNKITLFAGRLIARIESWRLGSRTQSALLHKLGFGEFNRPFRPERTQLDWLSRDEAEVDKYIADPLCGGPYSCQLWLDLLGGLSSIASDNALQRIRSDLPILFCGGADDPVGGDKGITQLAMHYAQTGHGRVRVKIYPEGRHEMFNETNRAEFSDDLLSWVENQLPNGGDLFAPARI
jgi:alpha-beta hydrolase superfamily lysophospholipase